MPGSGLSGFTWCSSFIHSHVPVAFLPISICSASGVHTGLMPAHSQCPAPLHVAVSHPWSAGPFFPPSPVLVVALLPPPSLRKISSADTSGIRGSTKGAVDTHEDGVASLAARWLGAMCGGSCCSTGIAAKLAHQELPTSFTHSARSWSAGVCCCQCCVSGTYSFALTSRLPEGTAAECSTGAAFAGCSSCVIPGITLADVPGDAAWGSATRGDQVQVHETTGWQSRQLPLLHGQHAESRGNLCPAAD